MYESNYILEKLPRHLMELVIEQPYNSYTAQDHAVWRYVMRQNVRYLSRVAHESYLEGLKKTGISIDSIPHTYGMNRILKEIGWAAVAVDGFIPPSAFMEFQAYNVLVIAADIRPIDQIEYTPAPDIIHEAAGHAPIIADSEYAAYLKQFGEIGSKAISSVYDNKIYEAIRHLSILKADPYSKKEVIKKAEEDLAELESQVHELSEMAMIRNLHWWTVEYGLIGDINHPKIYGAGLLSSIGESYSCLQPDVKKLHYDLQAKDVVFDTTTKQTQLFVTPDFRHLTNVLNEFADTMALTKGGLSGVRKAIDSETTATAVYSSGIQISGTFTEVISTDRQPIYIKTSGPTSLSYKNKELEGQGKAYHLHGFGSPIGKLKISDIPLEMMCIGDLASIDIISGKAVNLEFNSGLTVNGVLQSIIRKDDKIILMSFIDCTVTYQGQILFEPGWGIYDMAVGEKIVSVYSGPADPHSFNPPYKAPEEKTHKIIHNEKALKLHKLYEEVRMQRTTIPLNDRLIEILELVLRDYPDEWLLLLEILEIIQHTEPDSSAGKKLRIFLEQKKNSVGMENLIENGLNMISNGIK